MPCWVIGFFFSALAAACSCIGFKNRMVCILETSWHKWMIRWCESLEQCKERATIRSRSIDRSIKEYAKVADTEYKEVDDISVSLLVLSDVLPLPARAW